MKGTACVHCYFYTGEQCVQNYNRMQKTYVMNRLLWFLIHGQVSLFSSFASRNLRCQIPGAAIPGHLCVLKFPLIVRRISLTSEHVTIDFTEICIICHL
jgi:hypothetical protein